MQTFPFKPRPYQTLAIDHIIEHRRCAVWAGMGMGKTVTVLTAIDILMRIAQITKPVLIIAPLRVAKSTWPEEIKKWAHLTHLAIMPITGDIGARKEALSKNADIYTINYENLPWLTTHYQDDWPFEVIVADESTKLKGFRSRQGTARAKALASVAWKQAHRFIQLTGTPAPNGLIDLWGQVWFLDQGARLGKTFSAFTQRWFQRIPMGPLFFKLKPLPYAQDEIQACLKDLCLTLKAEDYFDIDQPILIKVEVNLPDTARRYYRTLEKELFVDIGESAITADNAAAKTMKCLQLCNGALYKEDGQYIEIHQAKIDALNSIIEESAGMPVLVAYQFKSDVQELLLTAMKRII